MKVVINKCYGGYSLSPEAAIWLFKKNFDEKGFKTPVDEYFSGERDENSDYGLNGALKKWREYLKSDKSERALFLTFFSPDEKFVLDSRPSNRSHPLLVKCIETLGKKANGACAELKIVEIPDGIDYEIQEYDGTEWIAEKHQTWG